MPDSHGARYRVELTPDSQGARYRVELTSAGASG